MTDLGTFIGPSLAAGTPLAIAGLGLLVNEKAGVVNLGAEGMLAISAVTGFATAYHTGSPWIALMAGALVAALTATAFGWLVIWLNTNQYATGLAVSLFGAGLSAFVGVDYTARKLADTTIPTIPVLRDLPFVGPALFRLHPIAYLVVALTAAVAWFMYRTRAGLVLRAIGEAPQPAHALGYRVRWIRLGAVVVGGALCGLAGAYISVIHTPLWAENMVGGRGWIALALTVFATWRPWRVLLGAYLFGATSFLQYFLQEQGVQVAPQFLAMLPYASTVVVLVLISRNPLWIRLNMPASLGKAFFPGA